MLRKIHRQMQRLSQQKSFFGPPVKSNLYLENLERRLLLATPGWWDELGRSSGSGGGVSWDVGDTPGETEIVLTKDGDPVVFWVEGTFNEYVGGNDGSNRLPFHFEMDGPIYARQYGGAELGWWDLSKGSGDDDSLIGSGSEIDVAVGPTGEIAVAWVSNHDINVADLSLDPDDDITLSPDNIYLKVWNGDTWSELGGSASGFGVSEAQVLKQTNEDAPIEEPEFVNISVVAENPSVEISNTGEIFVSYTAVHPISGQRDIVVKKYGFTYTDGQQEMGWIELVNPGVGEFASSNSQQSGGVSDDNGNSYDSSITVDMEGRPIVVWTNTLAEGNMEIYLNRWDGDSWEELGEGSASDSIGSGNSGVSSDPTVSMQPDVAVGINGDVIVTWVNWTNWVPDYDEHGEAGIFVKVLRSNSDIWEEYVAGSASVAGIATADNFLIAQSAPNPTPSVGLGWYYSPKIDTDSMGRPFVVWQGFGNGERFTASRTGTETTFESPLTGVYASHYENGSFTLLYDPLDITPLDTHIDNNILSNILGVGFSRGTANDPGNLSWMPGAVVGAHDELIIGYAWRDEIWSGFNHDNEIYVQVWDSTNSQWDPMGRGAMSNGNDIFGDYPNASTNNDLQMGLIDFDNDPTTEPDVMLAVSGGNISLYNRQTGKWSNNTSVSDIAFGTVFDLEGDPWYEYAVEGPPLLAYLHDNTGIPYVYQYVSGNWSLVGGGAAGPGGSVNVRVGTPLADVGEISVQAGPNGTILVAYTQDNIVNGVVTTQIVTRLWDPNVNSWADAGGGLLTANAPKEAIFHADFDNFNWDTRGSLELGHDQGGTSDATIENIVVPYNQRIYRDSTNDTGDEWYVWNQTNWPQLNADRLNIWSGAPGSADSSWVTWNSGSVGYNGTGGMEFTLAFPINDFVALVAASPLNTIKYEFDHQFDMLVGGHAIVEMAYAFDLTMLANYDLSIYLTIDGVAVSIDPQQAYPAGAIVTVPGGGKVPFSPGTSVKLDTQAMGLAPLTAGKHSVGFMIEGSINTNGFSPTTDQNKNDDQTGSVFIDNVAVYQRIVPEVHRVGPEASNFTANPGDLEAVGGNPAPGPPGSWGYEDIGDPGGNPGAVTEAWNANSGPLGTNDGALVMTLGDGVNANGMKIDGFDLEGQFVYGFNLAKQGDVQVEFDYNLTTGTDIASTDTLSLEVWVDGAQLDVDGALILNNTDSYQITGGGVSSGWNNIVLDISALVGGGPYVTGNHELELRGVLTNSIASANGTGTLIIDNVNVTSNMLHVDPVLVASPPGVGQWSYVDEIDSDAAVSGVWSAGAGIGNAGGLIMTLDDGATAQTKRGRFEYTFAVANTSYVTLDMSYLLSLDHKVRRDGSLPDTIDLVILLDDGQTRLISSATGEYQLEGTADWQDNALVLGWPTIKPSPVNDTGWQNINGLQLGVLTAGNYTVMFRGEMSDNENETASDNKDDTDGRGTLEIDNVRINQYSSYGEWESLTARGVQTDFNGTRVMDTGGNGSVGAGFDFRDDIHTTIFGAAGTFSQAFVIDNLVQSTTGDMEVSFRYRMNPLPNTLVNPVTPNIRVLIDDVVYTSEDPVNHPFPLSFSNNWASGSTYSWVRIVAANIQPGPHTVKIELDSTSTVADLWIDNLTIMGTPVTHLQNPMVTMSATNGGGSTRPFAVGVTNLSPSLRVYPTQKQLDDDADKASQDSVYPGGLIVSAHNDVPSGYYSANIFELVNNNWQKYGDDLRFVREIDFLGISTSENVRGNTTEEMAVGELLQLKDMLIGPFNVEWVGLQRYESEWLDNNGDGVFDTFSVHHWEDNGTVQEIMVWRWVPWQSNPTGGDVNWEPYWDDTGFNAHEEALEGEDAFESDETEFFAYTNLQMVSSGGQRPTVAYTLRNSNQSLNNSRATRYEGQSGGGQDIWGVLGESKSVQNNAASYWSALWLTEMIVVPDGDPLVGYVMGHLDSYGVREFRRDYELPSMTVTDATGAPGDNKVEFGVINAELGVVDRSFTVKNDGPGDLLIYDVQLGGFGDMDSNAIFLWRAPAFPIRVKADDEASLIIRFDPADVTPGDYSGVILVHTSEERHPSHRFSHFYELSATITVENPAQISIDQEDQWLNFENTTINSASIPQEIVIRNTGTSDLALYDWLFNGNNFEITSAIVSSHNVTGDEITKVISTTNGTGAGDDIVLAGDDNPDTNETLTLTVIFNPTEIDIYNETLFIHSNDTDAPIIPVLLTGAGITGAGITVKADGVVIPNLDGQIDFGSVIEGESNAIIVTLTNSGTTELTVSFVIINQIPNDNELVMTPTVIEEILLTPGISYDFPITYFPKDDGDDDIDELLGSLRIVSDTGDPEARLIDIELVGLGVPEIPILSFTDPDTGEAINILDFGTTYIGKPAEPITFLVENIGGAPTTLESFRLSAFNNVFSFDPQNNRNDDTDDILLPLSGTVPVTVIFTPNTTNQVYSTLSVWYKDENDQLVSTDQVLQLIGIATGQQLTITDTVTPYNNGEIDFGQIGQGQTSSSQTITLTNDGTTDLTITGWSLGLGLGSPFEIETFAGEDIILESGQFYSIDVTFDALAIGQYSDTVTITSDDPNSPQRSVDLLGQGVTPGQVVISPLSLEFGIVTQGNQEQRTFTIQNNGNDDLRVLGLESSSLYFILPDTFDSSDNTDYFDIEPGNENAQEITVVFVAANIFDSTLLATPPVITVVTNNLSGQENVTTEISLMAQVLIIGIPDSGESKQKIEWLDNNNNLVQVRVSGGGSATITQAFPDNKNIGTIELFNTDSRSVLTVIGPREGTNIGQIIGGTVKNIILKNVTLDGDQNNDGFEDNDNAIELDRLTGMLKLGNVTGGADINIGSVSGKGIKIIADNISEGTDINIQGPITNFQTNSFGQGSLTARSIKNLKIGKGSFDAIVNVQNDLNSANLAGNHIGGSFIVGGKLNRLNARKGHFSGTISANNIGSVSFSSMTDATLAVKSELKKLTLFEDMIDSRILGGYDLGADMAFGGGDDSLLPGGYLANIKVSDLMENSYIMAGVKTNANGDFEVFGANPPTDTVNGIIGKVRFRRVNTNNENTSFGVGAQTNIGSVLAGRNLYKPGDFDEDFYVSLL